MEKNRILMLTESAIMIALATVLSFVKIFSMPAGGSVTLLSMLPIIIIAYRYGVLWGMCTGGVYGILQLLLGLSSLRGVSAITFIGSLFFDYVLAFAALGLAGLFKNKIQNRVVAISLGAAFGIFGRFVFSFLSGLILWGDIAGDGFIASVISSAVYNGTYLGPELLITAIMVAVLSSFLDFSQKNLRPVSA